MVDVIQLGHPHRIFIRRAWHRCCRRRPLSMTMVRQVPPGHIACIFVVRTAVPLRQLRTDSPLHLVVVEHVDLVHMKEVDIQTAIVILVQSEAARELDVLRTSTFNPLVHTGFLCCTQYVYAYMTSRPIHIQKGI